MAKTSPEQLRRAVTEELVTYLGNGTLNRAQYAETIDYAGLNIDDFDRLKQLHFVLADDVVEYVERLPDRLRRLKSVTEERTAPVRGEVRGAIDWQATRHERARAGFEDRSLFVVRDHTVAYDIPENRVVKKLLAAIVEPLTADIQPIEQPWREMWDDETIVELQRTLARNLYLDAIPPAETINLTDRDLASARRSRHTLYTDSHRLYRLYEDLLNSRFDRPEVRKLLMNTLVTPADDHQLFELFCLFGVIRRLRRRYPDLKLQHIRPGMETIAVLNSDERWLEVYYDQNGPLRFFEEYPSAAELAAQGAPEMIQRHAAALEAHQEALTAFLGRKSQRRFYSGRPDFLVLHYEQEDGSTDNQTLIEALLGEVKYTQLASTFSRGLRELLEYIHLARTDDAYLLGESLPASQVTGLLCTDRRDTAANVVESIRHLTPDQLQTNGK